MARVDGSRLDVVRRVGKVGLRRLPVDVGARDGPAVLRRVSSRTLLRYGCCSCRCRRRWRWCRRASRCSRGCGSPCWCHFRDYQTAVFIPACQSEDCHECSRENHYDYGRGNNPSAPRRNWRNRWCRCRACCCRCGCSYWRWSRRCRRNCGWRRRCRKRSGRWRRPPWRDLPCRDGPRCRLSRTVHSQDIPEVIQRRSRCRSGLPH